MSSAGSPTQEQYKENRTSGTGSEINLCEDFNPHSVVEKLPNVVLLNQKEQVWIAAVISVTEL